MESDSYYIKKVMFCNKAQRRSEIANNLIKTILYKRINQSMNNNFCYEQQKYFTL